MQRFIVTYLTPLKKRGVIVVRAKTIRAVPGIALSRLFADGVFEILKVRELYNPYINGNRTITDYELSLLPNGIHSATDKFDVPDSVYNRIKQLYETGR